MHRYRTGPSPKVQEIIRFTEPRPVASDSVSVRGVISLRGKILPVVDVAERLGLPGSTGSDGKIVIVESESGPTIDDVEEVVTIGDEMLEAVPVADQSLVTAIAKLDERLVVVLAPGGVFAEAEAVELTELAAA